VEDTFQLDIVTPEKVVFSEPVTMVTAPGTAGEFGVLSGHAAFVTTLEIGEVTIKKEGREQYVAIAGGFAQVVDDKMIILAEAAEMAQEIDIKRAEAAKVRAEEKLKDLAKEEGQFQEIETALKRAQNRTKVSGRKT
jgi:F-type H+-transporting ATPase subunit epsilon